MSKSLRLSTVLILILALVLAAIVYFGYFYRSGKSPVKGVPLVTSLVKPKLLGTIVAEPTLTRPMAVAAGPERRTYVADTGNNRVAVFDGSGKLINTFGTYGQKDGEFNFPSGIAVSSTSKVYVADFKNNRVQVFDKDGKFIRSISENNLRNQDGKTIQFSPVAVAVGSKDMLYISDTFKQRILLVDSTNTLVRTIAMEGSGPGQILYANGIALDEKDNLLVLSDQNNARIQAFDLDGAFLWQQGLAGTNKDSKLVIPKGVAIAKEIIYVADTGAHLIAAYDLKGKFLYTFGVRSTEVTGFNFPTGMAWSAEQGCLLIADRDNNRVDIYK